MKQTKIPFFHPYVTEVMRKAAYDTLGGKIITQGQKVEKFEKLLNSNLKTKYLLTVNSCTSALELAYHLLELKPGDEIITSVFTFAGANTPLVRRGVKIVFADVKENLLMDWDDVQKKLTKKTKAIIDSHLFDQLNETRNFDIPVVGDAAQYFGQTNNERFTAYSFQAVKFLTTVDGGALVCQQKRDYDQAKLLRWFGIDRETDKNNIEVDIKDAGYKYHMNDVTAAIGIAGLSSINKMVKKKEALKKHYAEKLKKIPGIKVIGGSPFLIHVTNREKLRKKLSLAGIETSLALRRNDIYTIFGGKRQNLPNMNKLETTYLLLPCHNHVSIKDIDYISKTLNDRL